MKSLRPTTALLAALTLSAAAHAATPIASSFTTGNGLVMESRYPMTALENDSVFQNGMESATKLDPDRLASQVGRGLGTRLEIELELSIDGELSTPEAGVGAD